MTDEQIIQRVRSIEGELSRMQQVNKGIDSITVGWEDGTLTLYRFHALEDIVVDGSLTVTGGITASLIQTEAWTAPSLQNSWVNYDPALYQSAEYMLDPMGFVHLRGLIKDGTFAVGDDFFVLPLGYRPPSREIFVVANAGVPGYVQVRPDGSVEVNGLANNSWLSLAGITFKTS